MNGSRIKRKIDFTLGIVITLVALLWAQSVVSATTLSSMRIGQGAEKTRVVFDVKNIRLDKYKISRSSDDSKIFIDFYNTKNNLSFKNKHLSDKRLFKISVHGKNKKTRVTLDLHNPHKYRSFALAKNSSGSERLVLDLLNAQHPVKQPNKENTRASKKPIQAQVQSESVKLIKPASEKGLLVKNTTNKPVAQVQSLQKVTVSRDEPKDAAENTPVKIATNNNATKPNVTEPIVNSPINVAKEPEPSKSFVGYSTKLSNNKVEEIDKASANPTISDINKVALSPSLNESLIEKAPKSIVNQDSLVLSDEKEDLIIVLDPGHGGKDSGAVGHNGAYEKDVVLKIAQQMRVLIDKQPGMRAVMTRDKDVFIPLSERVKIAKSYKADLFISIHADAFYDRSIRGGSIYVLSESGASSAMAKLLQEKENSALDEISLDELDRDVAFALSDLSRESNIKDSHKLGKIVLKEMRKTVRMHKKTVQSAGFAVLKSIDTPSLLVETAFISNPSEAKRLVNPAFQKKMANAIVDGLKAYAKNTISDEAVQDTLYVDYRVRSGDTLSEIAEAYNVSTVTLKRVNKIKNANSLFVGKKIKIPVSNKVIAGV